MKALRQLIFDLGNAIGGRLTTQGAAKRGTRAHAPLRFAMACFGVQWRAAADEDGHYCFAVAL